MRIVIDTNIWVSALINPHGEPARLLSLFLQSRFEIVLCEELLNELKDVLYRPRIARKYNITKAIVLEFCELLKARAHLVTIFNRVNICRDPDDNVVIEAAIAGNALIIVSRDEDLIRDLSVKEYLAKVGIDCRTVRKVLDDFI